MVLVHHLNRIDPHSLKTSHKTSALITIEKTVPIPYCSLQTAQFPSRLMLILEQTIQAIHLLHQEARKCAKQVCQIIFDSLKTLVYL
jgi:hypothetical protein